MSSPASGSLVVFDASAVLALLFAEPGAEKARPHLLDGVLGAANLAEVLAKLSDRGVPLQAAIQAVAVLGLATIPVTEAHAHRSAEIRAATRQAGLSLGDRSCLALASELGAPALTADRGWTAVAAATGVTVLVIR